MALKRVVPLTSISGVAAGATATVSLPVGPLRYHRITLGYKTATSGGATEATMDSEISEIRMLINGKVQRRFSPAQLFNLNRQKGKTPTVSNSTSIPGYLTMFLAEPQHKTNTERELTVWGMLGVSTFQLEIDIAPGASSPVITGYAVIDDVPQPPQSIVKWIREVIQVSATGIVNYKLDTSTPDSYQDVTFIEGSAGDITNLLLTWDSLPLYQDDSNIAVELLNDTDYTRVSAYRHVPLSYNSIGNAVPSIRSNGAGGIINVGNFLAQLTMGNANNVTVMREMIGKPN